MDEKSEFLANMSHEMRTPLTAMLGFNEMIIRESTEKEIVAYAKNVDRAGRNLLAIINDILDFSRMESGKMTLQKDVYSLSALLGDLSNMMLMKAQRKGLQFTVRADPMLPDKLIGDRVRVRQIITNLLNNAVKYTVEGSVTLTVQRTSGPEQTAPRDLFLSVSVIDTGIGIRDEDMPRLFGKFERMDMRRNNSVEGSGLGLAITKHLTELMGGTIRLESRYGEGTRVTVVMPQEISDDAPIGDFRETFRNMMEEAEAYRVSFTAPQAKLLVVDDTAINLTVVRKLLKNTLIQIDTEESGRLALAKTQDIPYDLIFLDQRMSDLDGTQTLALIREQAAGVNHQTPVICLTADAVSGARERYLAEGFTDYLTKPVDSRAMEDMVRRYLPREKVLTETDKTSPRQTAEATNDGAPEIPAFPEKELRRFYEDTGDLSFRSAIGNCVDAETLSQVLKQYYDDIPVRADEIGRFLEEGDIRGYTVRVHALKSASRMIGALALSERARELEILADEGRTEELNAQTPALLAAYRRMHRVLEALFA